MVLSYEVLTVCEVFWRFPGVLGGTESSPLDKVVPLTIDSTIVEYFLYFVLGVWVLEVVFGYTCHQWRTGVCWFQ